MTLLNFSSTSSTEGGADPRRRPDGAPLGLLIPPSDTSVTAHLRRWGPMGLDGDLLGEIARSGLRGRGGAAFPVAVKMTETRAAAGRRRPVVVGNGSEGEPLSAKDAALLAGNAHLVLDGLVAAAAAVGADRAILCLKEGSGQSEALARCVAARPGDVHLDVREVPDRYIVGEESALVNWLNTGRPQPLVSPPRPARRGVGRRPTLVHNVETLADIALIARFGASWWRQFGTPEEPGSHLVTVTGAVGDPGVQEVEHGTPLAAVLERAGLMPTAGLLVGGYFGCWVSPEEAATVRLSRVDLSALGASIGCGVIAVLGAGRCPLPDVALVTRWLAGQSAGQCGPCVHGLPALAGALEELATGDADSALGDVRRVAQMVDGRGACKLPDGVARMVRSALRVFGDHIDRHRRDGHCAEGTGRPSLATPVGGAR